MTAIIILSTTGEVFAANIPAGKVDSMANWCSQTLEPNLCNSIMTPLKSGTSEQAMRLAIRFTLDKFNLAMSNIESILKTSNDSMTKVVLESCRRDYEMAIKDIKDSQKDNDIPLHFSAVIAMSQTCGDEMDARDLVIPFRDLTTNLNKLGGIVLALNSLR
ncbi:hypothetical protein NE237_021009 [Protea cynaroides]|uniref:Pectinesterase inhibitor domain-containing protein n=1 Tax=Protea cynaroides TaxID=273540 RepID=A0A9Q0K273_9MAGN|nr:hypothetical protein NE237_021009 [Protea cynaroides]